MQCFGGRRYSAGEGVNIKRGPLSSTCGFMMSARIASPCFPRPRFELGLSSRVPPVFRQTSSTVTPHQVAGSPIVHCDVLDVGPPVPYFSSTVTIMFDVLDNSATDSLADAPSSWLECVLTDSCSEQLLQRCYRRSLLRSPSRPFP